jgi:twitching motility protein PilT
LAALLDRINRTHAKHIVTIEDPVEYLHASLKCIVSQREVGRDSGSFAEAVHGALRSDPDVILLGEMRDAVTMHAAVTAAETGHLVFATLHTADAAQAVDRIIGMFGGEMQEQIRIQLAQTLAAVVCLRLVPRSSGAGRCCAAELLLGTDAARALIRDGKTHQLRALMETSRAMGMQTLESHLGELASIGEIAVEDARAACVRPSELRTAAVR